MIPLAAERCWSCISCQTPLFFYSRLAVVKEEREAMAKALERLQMIERDSTPSQEWKTRDVGRMLEQLVEEKAKSQRSTSKWSQERRLLMEKVKVEKISLISFLLRTF